MANFYWGREGWWGLFDTYGQPTKNYHAMACFSELLSLPVRAATRGNDPANGVAICAAYSPDDRSAAVLMTNLSRPQDEFDVELNDLPWPGASICQAHLVDEGHDLSAQQPIALPTGQKTLRLSIPPETVCLLRIRPA
jgi:hypothetical protein